jgi:hypothetical protein
MPEFGASRRVFRHAYSAMQFSHIRSVSVHFRPCQQNAVPKAGQWREAIPIWTRQRNSHLRASVGPDKRPSFVMRIEADDAQ